jgi:hypothetical protein
MENKSHPQPPSEQTTTPTELTNGARMDFHRANPELKSLQEIRQEAADVAEKGAAEEEAAPLTHERIIGNVGKGIIRLRVMTQQEALGQTSRPRNDFEMTR